MDLEEGFLPVMLRVRRVKDSNSLMFGHAVCSHTWHEPREQEQSFITPSGLSWCMNIP